MNPNNYYAATEETFATTGYYGVRHYYRDADGVDHEEILQEKFLSLDDARALAAELNAQNEIPNEEA